MTWPTNDTAFGLYEMFSELADTQPKVRDAVLSVLGGVTLEDFQKAERDRLATASHVIFAVTEAWCARNGVLVQDSRHVLAELNRQRARIEAKRLLEAEQATDDDWKNFAGKLLDTDQLMALPAPEWLVSDYLVRDSLAMLYGPSGSYKTFLALDWALSVATGNWWNGHKVDGGRVFYVIAEGANGLGKRIQAWKDHHKAYNLDASTAPIAWYPGAINLASPHEVELLTMAVEATRPRLVVVDTLARCTLGAEENSVKEMGLVIAALDAVRQASGACVLTVHHTGVSVQDRARGSSALKAAIHTELELTKSDNVLTLKVTKQKDDTETTPLRLSPIASASSCVLVPAERVPPSEELPARAWTCWLALSEIALEDGVSATQWEVAATAKEVSRASFYRAKKQLIEVGVVSVEGSPTRQRYRPSDQALEDQGLMVSTRSHQVSPAESPGGLMVSLPLGSETGETYTLDGSQP